jgi:TolB-like protein/tetratricopeptide (TPR) repeat protein
MTDRVSAGVASATTDFGQLSTLLKELAAAPPGDLLGAWQRRLEPGDVVGRFEILREIGRGGFGVVYEALDRQLGRSVAFKTLRPARTGHELSADWILREAEAVARLDHPAIVTLFDVGRCESGPYLVEELLRGETLAERIGRGPLQFREVLTVGLEFARALAHAHQRGVLHRDLKPGNVFLTEDGRVKLLDFGLAHLQGTRGLPGAGTPAYMAPEQLRGDTVDSRADVFSFGATLHHALAGQVPFPASDVRTAALDTVPPPALPDETPPALAALVQRCISRVPSERPANGQAVVDALLSVERVLDGERHGLLHSRVVWIGALLAVAALAAGGLHLANTGTRSESTVVEAAPAIASVAVLPFADISPARDQEYFANGVAEEILNALGQVRGLKVIGRTSSFSFKGSDEDLRAIGEKLGVGSLLQGSVRKEGSRVRITARLVRTSDESQLWSKIFEREQEGVFAVQDEIARDVAFALRGKLFPGEDPAVEEHRTTDPGSYDYYLMGVQFLRQRGLNNARRSRSALQKALELDPNNARAYAAMAWALENLYEAGEATTVAEVQQIRRKALDAAEQAVALAPNLADGYLVRGFLRLMDFEWAGGRADFDRALAIGPNDPRTLALHGLMLATFGGVEEGIKEARRAAELDPISRDPWSVLCRLHQSSGQLAVARSACDRFLEIEPDGDWSRMFQVTLELLKGDANAALSAAQRLFSEREDLRFMSFAMAEHDLGRTPESDRALAEFIAMSAHYGQYQIAEVYAWRGDADRAFEWLERSHRERDPAIAFLKHDPLLRRIRADPRYAALVEKANLPLDHARP